MQKSMFDRHRLVRLVWLGALVGGLSSSIPVLQPISALAQTPGLEEPDRPDQLDQLDQDDRIDVQWGKAWETMIQGNGKRWNLELPTLGGKQFWTDHRWWNGYRLQYNPTLEHWRLIDPGSVRKGWGTKEAMLELLQQIQEKETQGLQGKKPQELTEVFLLLHGLMRTSSSMKPVEEELLAQIGQKERADSFAIIRFGYASTRSTIASHAQAFRELVENLPGKPRVKISGHSLGNIVTRLAIAQWTEQGDPQGILKRIDRVVMMGPPNQGSSFAKRLSYLGLFEMVTGKSGMQLGPQWDGLSSSLGIPPCPFKIIAGDLTGSTIQNPLLDGPNDAVVTVEETKLDGMTELKTYPVLHSFLMQDPKCVEDAVEFLLREIPPKSNAAPGR